MNCGRTRTLGSNMMYAITALTAVVVLLSSSTADAQISLHDIGRFQHEGPFDSGASEIVAYDPETQRLFVANAALGTIDILNIEDPTMPTLFRSISVVSLGLGKQPNYVAVHDGVVAAAIEATIKQEPGRVAFFDPDGNLLNSVMVGALPDMLTFTPDGEKLLVANEGEPNASCSVDPEGSVSIIDVSQDVEGITQADVITAGFAAFNGTPLDPSIRSFAPNAAVFSLNAEPEYIAVSSDSRTAYVTLQENNAIAVVDIDTGVVTHLHGLGYKDHNVAGSGLDASDRDTKINIRLWPVQGMYQPDAIAAFGNYLVMANEGDVRDHSGCNEQKRVGDADYILDPTVFPNAADLKKSANLGRLRVTKATGDTDGDGDYDVIHPFGARSFAIRDRLTGELLWDSGDQLEQITAAAYPKNFNSDHTANTFDTRSASKGPEPEGLAVGEVDGIPYAFIGLERISGVVVYDISDPLNPVFVQYVNPRNFGDPTKGPADDRGPEGVLFIEEGDSPSGRPLLVVANEVSGTTTIFEITTP